MNRKKYEEEIQKQIEENQSFSYNLFKQAEKIEGSTQNSECDKYKQRLIFLYHCQRPGILSSRSERILSVRDKVKCQGGEKKKLTQPEGNVSFRKREQKLPAKTHEALRSLPSVALSSVVGKSLSIKRVHGT